MATNAGAPKPSNSWYAPGFSVCTFEFIYQIINYYCFMN